jgi:hypothetical protein
MIKQVEKQHSGKVVAIDMAVGSGLGIITPMLGGYLLTEYGF